MRYGEIARKIREESKIMESSAARLNASIRIGRRVLINAKKLQEWLDNQSEVWVD